MRCHRTVLVMIKRLLPSTSPVDTARELAPTVLVHNCHNWSNHFNVSFCRQMSCFDRDHRVVVQRRNSSGTVTKNGLAPDSTSSAVVRASAPGAPPVQTTPRQSKTAHANSTIKLKNLKERLSEDCSINEDQKLDLEIGESNFTNGSISSDSTVGHN